MPEEVRLWRILDGDRLEACNGGKLDLEGRLESWLAKDISILDPNLLVIGRQVETDTGGYIDLLCLDDAGNLVIVELKRDRTPREITAQVLDYASWVKDLGSERITTIAEGFLGLNTSLEQAFESRFGHSLPDVLNSEHRMLVVGSNIDPASERIIRYLSETYGVGINAATFNFLRTSNGEEFLARVFLIEIAEANERTLNKSGSKRQPNLTCEELEGLAEDAGVGEMYRSVLSQLEATFGRRPTRSSIGFTGKLNGGAKAVFSLVPGQSDKQHGLRFQLYSNRLVSLLGISMQNLRDALPAGSEPWAYVTDGGPDYEGFTGFFREQADVDRLMSVLVSQK